MKTFALGDAGGGRRTVNAQAEFFLPPRHFPVLSGNWVFLDDNGWIFLSFHSFEFSEITFFFFFFLIYLLSI